MKNQQTGFILALLVFVITLGLTLASSNSAQAQDHQKQGELSWSIFGGVTNGGDTLALGNTNVTYGRDGEQVTAVDYSENLKTGGFAVFGVGVNYKFNDRFSVQLNGGYHWDRISDPEIKFTRVEVELIPYYQLSDNLQLGLGLVSHFSLKLTDQSTPLLVKPARSDEDTELRVFNEFSDALAPSAQDLISGQARTDEKLFINSQTDFSNATGYLASIVYQLPQWHSKVELRAVFIDYKANMTTSIADSQQVLDTVAGEVKLDARHAGIYWHFVF
jgi:hypothetical protein